MSKVYLDSTPLNSGCVIRLNDSLNVINKALSYFKYFDIPYDFKKRNTLNDVENTLKAIKKELESIKSWIVNSSNNYETLINNLKSQASSLPGYQVKQRNNTV